MTDIVPNEGSDAQGLEPKIANLPTEPAWERLTIMPCGINLYRDLERGKDFLALHFARQKVGPGTAKGFEAAVRADLAQAGIPLGDGGKAEVTPHKEPRYFNCFVQVPVLLAVGDDAVRWFERMREGCARR